MRSEKVDDSLWAVRLKDHALRRKKSILKGSEVFERS